MTARQVIVDAVYDALTHLFFEVRRHDAASLRTPHTPRFRDEKQRQGLDGVSFEALTQAVERCLRGVLGDQHEADTEALDVIWAEFGKTWLPGRKLNQARFDFVHLTQDGWARLADRPMTPEGCDALLNGGAR